MKVLFLDTPLRRELDPAPAGVQLVAEPGPEVEFVVLSFEIADRLPGLFDELPRLRVIQSLSAGVDWLLPGCRRGSSCAGPSASTTDRGREGRWRPYSPCGPGCRRSSP